MLQQMFDQLGRPDRRRLIDRYKRDREQNQYLDWVGWLADNL